MFTSIFINNFRCFEDFSIESLDRVNLIAGTNNVGKTALLEAIFLLLGTGNIGLVVKISSFRGIEQFIGNITSVRELIWNPLFFKFDSQATIKISGTLNTGEQQGVELRLVPRTSARLDLGSDSATENRLADVLEFEPGANGLLDEEMELQYTDSSGKTGSTQLLIDEKGISIKPVPSAPPFPGFFLAARRRTTLGEDAERFGRLEEERERYNLLEALRIVEPNLERLATIFRAGVPMIYGDIGLGRMLPLSLMGDGLARLTSLLLTIVSASDGVVLVDEIENGLHHSILDKVWRAIGDAARHFKTQVFATTHSYECIRAAHQAFEGSDGYDFRLYRLERVGKKIEAVTYNQKVLAAAMKADMEVR